MKLVGPIPNEFAPTWPQESRPDNFVFAPHWYVPSHLTETSTDDDRYDLNTLFKKSLGFMTVDVQGMARVSLYHPHNMTYRLTVRECTFGMPSTLGERQRNRITLCKSRTLLNPVGRN